MNQKAIEAVLGGIKTIETRFSLNKIAPFGAVSAGDTIFMKPPGKDISGQFRVKKVFSFEGLNSEDIDRIFTEWDSKIGTGDEGLDKKYRQEKRHCLFGTLIFISKAERLITSPIKFRKKDLRGWVVLDGE